MHHTLAMSSTEHNLWTIANILGIVVVVAVAALLSLLIYLVKIIDRRVVAVKDTLIKVQLVDQTRAATGLNGNAQAQIRTAFLLQEAANLAGSNFSDLHTVGGQFCFSNGRGWCFFMDICSHGFS